MQNRRIITLQYHFSSYLAAKCAEIFRMLSDFHLFHSFTKGSTITGSILANNTNLLRTFSLKYFEKNTQITFWHLQFNVNRWFFWSNPPTKRKVLAESYCHYIIFTKSVYKSHLKHMIVKIFNDFWWQLYSPFCIFTLLSRKRKFRW